MKHEKLSDALNEIPDAYIEEAAAAKKRPLWRWVGAVAAVLAVVLVAGMLLRPATQAPPALHSPKATASPLSQSTPPMETSPIPMANLLVAKPKYPQMVACPEDPFDMDTYHLWQQSRYQQYNQPRGYADNLESFFAQSIPVFLNSDTENLVYSPANVYMALAMLAETTGGDTQQEILNLLNAGSIAALREQAGYLWNAHYCDDKMTTLLLANSLWLDDSLLYRADTAQLLAQDYYASVYHGDLGTEKMNQALQQWLNDNTGGLLREQAADMTLDPGTLMALASTIYYKVQWGIGFQEERSQEGIFHGPDGVQTVTYMYSTIESGQYYYGEDYAAVPVPLADGSRMWLILPDLGHTPQDILQSGHALKDLLGPSASGEYAGLDIHLQLPKFDVASETDLRQGLQALGLHQVFSPAEADFSGIAWDPLYIMSASHAARVKIDEEGIEASAYTVMQMYGTGLPPEVDDIDFILDRPFLFIIESASGVPLFTGVVNQP